MENKLAQLRMLNKQIGSLREKYAEYEDYYRDASKMHNAGDDELINVNIQLNYKGQQIIELRDMTKANLQRANDLSEKLMENRDGLVGIHNARADLETNVVRADQHVTSLTRREMYKRYMLVALIVLLGALDFIALIYRITRLFR